MNWGKGITIGMSIFMLFIIGLGILMFMAPSDDYDHQYYEKGLNYNKDYNREEQVVKDHAKPTISLHMNTLRLSFAHAIEGRVSFNRPSDHQLDKAFTVRSNAEHEVIIPLQGIQPGQWQLIMEWTNDNKQYMYRQEVFVP